MSSYIGNCTKSTISVATLGNLDVSGVPWRGNHARLFYNIAAEVVAIETVEDFGKAVNTKKFVHFGYFGGEFLLVTL